MASRGGAVEPPRPAERPVYKVRLKLDLAALGLPETATATDMERAAASRAPKKKRAGKKPDPTAELEAEIAADLDGQDPSGRLTRIAPGVFELTIKKHDFAIILVE